MTIRLLEEVCDTLRSANLVQTEREFCEQWLAKSECYVEASNDNSTFQAGVWFSF